MAEAQPPASERAPVSGIDAVVEAVESGAGLPALARAIAAVLDTSLVVLDGSSSVVAVACQSSEDERAVLAGERGAQAVALRVADRRVGELRLRSRAEAPDEVLRRVLIALLASELERSAAPERASEAAIADFLRDLLSHRLAAATEIAARSAELGCDLSEGACVVVARARPNHPEQGDWRARALTVAGRGARGVVRSALAASTPVGPPRLAGATDRHEDEFIVLVPGAADLARRAADGVLHELLGLDGYAVAVGVSRQASDPADLYRAGSEALLAVNVAEARGAELLAFEETGAYRLLLGALSEDPNELRRFHAETVAPVAEYDEQYDTELVRTLETFLDADGNVANTAERLFTHRHTVRYRLDRVRELSGLDVSSTDGRERLSLGLKAMRVLGLTRPGSAAQRRARRE